MKFSKVIIISDFDGTLTDARTHNICGENIKAVRYFIENGGRFAICSGRSLPSIERCFGELTFNLPLILCNGAFVYDFERREIIWSKFMNSEIKPFVAEIIERFPGVGAEAFTASGEFVIQNSEFVTRRYEVIDAQPKFKTLDELGDDILKINFMGEHEFLLEVEKYAKSRSDYEYDMVFSGPTFFEVLDINTDKAAGVSRLLSYLGAESEYIIIAGNYFNDLPMLKLADISACPADSPLELLSACDIHLRKCSEAAIDDLIGRIDAGGLKLSKKAVF